MVSWITKSFSSVSSFESSINSLIRFFLYVLIFWLPYSPAVIEVCVIISLVLWIIKRASRLITNEWKLLDLKQKIVTFLRAFYPPPTPLNLVIGLFLLSCIFSVICSIDFFNSLYNVLTKTLEWFIVFFLIVETFTERKHFKIVLSVFFITALATCLDALQQYYLTHKDIFFGRTLQSGRATAGFHTPNGLGAYLTITIPFFLSLFFLSTKHRLHKLLITLVLAISLGALFVSFSRAAILGVVIGGVFLIFKALSRKKYFYLMIFGVLIFMSFLLIYKYKPLLTDKTTLIWRLDVWRASAKMIEERPLIGFGINTFMATLPNYREGQEQLPAYAHNCYLQLAVETGIIGLTAFLFLIFTVYKNAFSYLDKILIREREWFVVFLGLLSGISAYLIHSFFDTNLYSLQLSVYFWYIIGLIFSTDKMFNNLKNYDIKKSSI